MRVFLTGGTGYIGGALARRLLAGGSQVRALARPTSDARELESLGAELVRGDLSQPEAFGESLRDVDWVVHAAADLEMDGDSERMAAVNVEGSRGLAEQALRAGVPRLLLLSSVAAFGGSPDDGKPVAESCPRRPPAGLYGATKRAGEDAVRRVAARGLGLNVVFPSLVYGPPAKRTGANALLRALARGRFPAIVGADRKTSWVHLDDLVAALAAILGGAPAGRDYLLTGDIIRIDRLFETVSELTGRPVPRLRLSPGVAGLGARLAAPAYRLRGRRPPFGREQLRSMGRHWAFDDGRARRELAWSPRSLADGLPGAIAALTGP